MLHVFVSEMRSSSCVIHHNIDIIVGDICLVFWCSFLLLAKIGKTFLVPDWEKRRNNNSLNRSIVLQKWIRLT